jgi:nucleotide-binding universal stress UspA family protein
MSPEVVSCYEDDSVEDAARIMAERRVRRLVVLDRAGHLAGILSLGDIALDSNHQHAAHMALKGVSQRRPHRPVSYRHIIVALDGSEEAEGALPTVEALARQFGSRVTVLRAVMPIEAALAAESSLAAAERGRGIAATAPAPSDVRKNAVAYLVSVRQRLEASGIEVTTEHPEGRYAEAIVSRAAHHGADLIVMTTHGYGGIKRAVIGSVADEVVRTAPCPVLLIRSAA